MRAKPKILICMINLARDSKSYTNLSNILFNLTQVSIWYYLWISLASTRLANVPRELLFLEAWGANFSHNRKTITTSLRYSARGLGCQLFIPEAYNARGFVWCDRFTIKDSAETCFQGTAHRKRALRSLQNQIARLIRAHWRKYRETSGMRFPIA